MIFPFWRREAWAISCRGSRGSWRASSSWTDRAKAEEVRGHLPGVAAAVGNDQDLTGAGDHVDVHQAEYLPLGLRHVGVAWAHDLVHLGHGLRAVGQGGHRLRAAHAKDPVHPGNGRGGQDHRVDVPAAGRGRDHHHLAAAGQLGGDGVHQHAGGVGGGAAGDVEPHPVQGRHLLAQDHAGALGNNKALPDLPAVEVLDAVRGLLQNGPEVRSQIRRRGLEAAGGNLEIRQLRLVKLLGVPAQGGVPLLPHGAEDGGDGGAHVGALRRLPPEDLGEGELVDGVDGNHGCASFLSACRRSSTRRQSWVIWSYLNW